MSEEDNPTDLSGIEAALSKLAPREPRLDRDRLMYLAGQASARKHAAREWLWPLATAASLAVSATLGLMLAARSSPVPGQDVPQVVATSPAGGDYLRLRTLVLTQGVEALPATPPHAVTAPSELPDRSLWKQLHEI